MAEEKHEIELFEELPDLSDIIHYDEENDMPWVALGDLEEKLGYGRRQSTIYKDNKEAFKGLTKLDTRAVATTAEIIQRYKVRWFNEEGIYLFLLKSDQPKAVVFRIKAGVSGRA